MLLMRIMPYLVLVMSVPGWAACNFSGNAREGMVTLSFGNVTVLPGTPAGSIIATTNSDNALIVNALNASSGGAQFMKCNTGDLSVWGGSTFGTTEFNGEALIDTGLQGLAIRTSTSYTSTTNGAAFGTGVKFPPDYSAAMDKAEGTAFQYGRRIFQLVKTGDVVGGEIPGGTLVVNSAGGITILTWVISASSVINAGCEVSDYPPEVSLGTAYSQQFRSSGDTANETDFTITLTCNSAELRPAIAFEGVTDDAYPTVFSNSPGDGYAKNVGVCIFRPKPTIDSDVIRSHFPI